MKTYDYVKPLDKGKSVWVFRVNGVNYYAVLVYDESDYPICTFRFYTSYSDGTVATGAEPFVITENATEAFSTPDPFFVYMDYLGSV